MRRFGRMLRTCSSAALLAASAAAAQQFPARPVTVIVPFGAGGPTDVVARALQPIMEQSWKQPFVLEFRPGGGGVAGTDLASRATPDGYTLLLNSNGVFTSKLFTKDLPYDASALRPVVELAGANFLIVTNPQVPAKTLTDFVGYLKSRGKAVNAGSVPNNASWLDLFVFQRRAGVDYTVVNYNGLPDIINATLRNDIQFFLAVPASVAGQIADNKLVAIANAAPQRNEKFPNVPTARESGVDFLSGFSFGIWVPSKTPDAIVAKIAADMEKAALSPEYVARMKTLNFEVPQRPRDYPMRAQQEDRQYTEIARQIGVQPH